MADSGKFDGGISRECRGLSIKSVEKQIEFVRQPLRQVP